MSSLSMKDLVELAVPAGERLVLRGETVAVTESSSGGLVSAALLAVPGASRYFLGGGVTYTGPARALMLALPQRLPELVRSSSEPYAALAARAVRERLNADWGLAETGAAGPTGNRYGDPAGHTCVAVAGKLERSATLQTGSSDRLANMFAFAAMALEALSRCLEEVDGKA
jgi:nicotinamide-nucleotide amidase